MLELGGTLGWVVRNFMRLLWVLGMGVGLVSCRSFLSYVSFAVITICLKMLIFVKFRLGHHTSRGLRSCLLKNGRVP